jgi:pantetheine-phosphate adenylyltransferase
MEMVRYVVCLGGTFSPFHRGHLMLLETGFSVGKVVMVGLTTDTFARSGRTRKVLSYSEREAALRDELDRLSLLNGIPYTIGPISDKLGFAHLPEVEAIVVSVETERYVDMIDAKRADADLPPLRRFVVQMVLDENGKVLSSTSVQRGAVDAWGRALEDKTRGDP